MNEDIELSAHEPFIPAYAVFVTLCALFGKQEALWEWACSRPVSVYWTEDGAVCEVLESE